jgi:hypothetical protein
MFPFRSHTHLLAPDNPLESLLCNLSLRRGDHLLRIRVAETASRLAVLVAGSLGGANTLAGGCDLSAACGAAVSVCNAAAGDELRAVAGSDVLCARVVGGDLGHGGGGNWMEN